MKTRIATLLFVFGLFIVSSAFAMEPVPASKAVSKKVANLIQDELDYPEFAIVDKFECCVVVSVLIQDDGTFDVTGANSISKDMIKHVIKTIEKMEPEDLDKYAGQEVGIKVIFDLR